MSTTDLYAADFPHGTPAGYDNGCRSNTACPAFTEHGMSCATAKTKANGDYTVSRMFARGDDVATIAAHVNGAPAPATTLAAALADAQKAKAEKTTKAKPSKPTPAPKPAPAKPKAPEPEVEPAAAAEEQPKTAEQVTAVAAKRAPKTRAARIRAWAKDKGYDVPARGTIAREIVEHYNDTHPDDPADITVPAADAWAGAVARATDTPEADVRAATAIAAPETASDLTTALAAARVAAAQAEARDADASPHAVILPDVVAGARVAMATDGDSIAVAMASEDDPSKITVAALPAEAKPERPDWGSVAESVDVERARAIAVRLEQELARAEEERDAAVSKLQAVSNMLAVPSPGPATLGVTDPLRLARRLVSRAAAYEELRNAALERAESADKERAEAVDRAEAAEVALQVALKHWDKALDTIAQLHMEIDELNLALGERDGSNPAIVGSWALTGDVSRALADAGVGVLYPNSVEAWSTPAVVEPTPAPEKPTRMQRFAAFLGLAD
ncbi:Lsr2 family DNA-binding protein [Microbacterium sp. KNMS]